jgi:hypothetical protein
MTKMGFWDRERRGVSADLTSDLGPGMHPRISIKGGQFHLIDAGTKYAAPIILKQTPQGQRVVMLAIIVGSNPKKSRIFYDQPYDPDNPGPPDCFSDNGVAPSADASSPQSRTCAECHFSKWGSDYSQLTNKKTKACSEKKKVAILVLGDTTRRPYELDVPPASLKNLATYAGLTAGHSPPGLTRKADIADFVTEISFVPGSTGVLSFEAHCWLSSVATGANEALEVTRDPQGRLTNAEDGGDSVGDLIDDIWENNELTALLGLEDRPWTPPAGFVGPGMQPVAIQGPRNGPAAVTAPAPYTPQPGAIAQAPTQAFASPATAPPAGAEPQPARQRGRPRKPVGAPQQALPEPQKATNVAPFQQAAAATEQAIPGFLHRPRTPPTPAPAGNGQFGLTEAAPPPTSMEGALNVALNLPTKR